MTQLPFYGVLGKPYLDLTPFISTDGLDEVAEEMATLFVRHGSSFATVMFDDDQELHPELLSTETLGFDCKAHPRNKPMLDGPATRSQLQAYNSFFSPVLPLEQYMQLRIRGVTTPWAQYVPKTMAWIDRLPCNVARITVYFSSPGQMMGAHRDSPLYPGYNTPLIYINPLLKPFYVIDGEGEKHIIDSKVAHFNNCDFHGMDQSNYYSAFSIRAQGRWHDWFVDATNTRDHFAGSPIQSQ